MKNTKEWSFNHILFEYLSLLDTTTEAWAGHTRFAYDLVANLQPKLIVELGTYKGTSFFSFAQAIKNNSLATKLVGIDTWEGDIHTGFYADQVYKDLKKIKTKWYPKVPIVLKKMTFDEAVADFSDNSIEVLHIDGLHTYEAVKHDFDTWKHKVSETGIILFHDIHYKKRGFGVYKFWKELKAQYSTLEFPHSNGLGVVVLDENIYAQLRTYAKTWEAYYPVLAMNDALSGNFSANEFDKLSVAEKEAYISNVTDKRIKQLEKTFKAELSQLSSERDGIQNQLNSVTNSKVFKVWQAFCKVRDSLIKS